MPASLAWLFLADVIPTGWGETIPPKHLDAAARLGHYFLGHALAVFDQMAAEPERDDAHHVLDWRLRTGRSEFTRREAFSALSRLRFRRVADLDPALQTLTEHGFLRQLEPPPGSRAGRPASPRWEVHPASAESAQSAEL
ncbi:hypothetical protein [Pseudonocardia xishanensis]|uniref:Uncharacterized protein n=1 Tax=Pseudonocardia xishanensis TaxID=630995 RepID=A0ABP8RD10_9PSEU